MTGIIFGAFTWFNYNYLKLQHLLLKLNSKLNLNWNIVKVKQKLSIFLWLIKELSKNVNYVQNNLYF